MTSKGNPGKTRENWHNILGVERRTFKVADGKECYSQRR